MANKKNEKPKRGYRLMVRCGNKSICLMEAKDLEEIDALTMNFDGVYDFGALLIDLGFEFNRVDSVFIRRIDSDKIYKVLYIDDIFDKRKVLDVYRGYLVENSDYLLEDSPVRFVSLNREDYSKYENYAISAFFAYFSDNNYRKIRGAYLELKNLGLGKQVLNNNLIIRKKRGKRSNYNLEDGFGVEYSKNYIYYSDDAYLDSLLNKEGGPDWEAIYNVYSKEDVERLLKKEVRKRRR